MSTKIYNGYRHKKVSTDELFELFEKLREEFNVVAQNLINNLAMRLSVNIIDRLSLGIDIKEGEDNPYITESKDGNIKSFCWYVFLKKIPEAFESRERNPSYDLSIKCSVLKTDLDPDNLYFIFYYEKKEYKEVIEKYFEPYPYWNNTDPPKGCSWEEWGEIGDQWNDAIRHRDIPSLNGFSMKFNTQYTLPEIQWEEVSKNFPTKEERVNLLAPRLVQELLFNERCPAQEIKEGDSEEKSKEIRNQTMRTITQIFDEINRGKHDDKILVVKSKLMKILPNLDENTDLTLNIYETYYNKDFDIKLLIEN